MSFVDDLCNSTFLQATLLLVVFLAVLAWVNKKQGRLPPEVVAERLARQAEKLAEQQSQQDAAKKPVIPTKESIEMLRRLKEAVVALDPAKLSKLEFHESDDTRIDNKRVVFLCLRDPATGELYKWNDLVYVTIHEMAHAISAGYDPMHTSVEFQSNFWMLLRRAERNGIYKPSEAFTNEYCALPIDKNDPGVVIR